MKKLGRLAALLALILIPAMAQQRAAAASPCPAGCGYKYDPVTRCCITDPRFDCFDICF